MQRKQGGLVPIGEALANLPGPVKAIRDASPQSRHHFTQADQVNQLVTPARRPPISASWRGRWRCAPCPAPTPATATSTSASTGRTQAHHDCRWRQLPYFGNLPRLLLAWVCSEAVRTPKPRTGSWGSHSPSSCGPSAVYSSSGGSRGYLSESLRRWQGERVRLDGYRGRSVSRLVSPVWKKSLSASLRSS